MKSRFLGFVSVFVLASASAACSSSDDVSGTMSDVMGSGGESADGGGEPAGETCDPNGEIPCHEGIAEPCQDYETPFPGDEYCLAVPDPSIGVQIHVGPDDYDDPDQVAKYALKPGEETNWAEISEFPNDTTIYSDGYVSHMRPGSHHFILYGIDQSQVPDQSTVQTGQGAEAAVGALGGNFLAGATKPIQDALVLSDNPEDQGIGNEIPAHRPVAVNLHFINTSTDTTDLQEIWVNFHKIAEEDVRLWAKPMTWYGGLSMAIPPGTQETLTNPTPCVPPAAAGDSVRIVGITGHVHASTVRYNATYDRQGVDGRQYLFEDYEWEEPSQFNFNNTEVNNPPDPDLQVTGGYSGVFMTQPGDQYHWECEVHNETDTTLHFANHVYTAEMCCVFGFYATENRDAGNWLCAF